MRASPLNIKAPPTKQQVAIDRSQTTRGVDLEIDFWQKFLDSGLYDTVYAIIAGKIILDIYVALTQVNENNKILLNDQGESLEVRQNLLAFAVELQTSLTLIYRLTFLIAFEVLMITIITYMNYLFEWKDITCRNCLLVKRLRRKRIPSADPKIAKFEIEIRKYNPWSTLIIIIDLALWVTILVLDYLYGPQISATSDQLDALVTQIYPLSLETKMAYIDMRLQFNIAMDQYDQLGLLYALIMLSLVFFLVWETIDFFTQHKVTQCLISFFCVCCCIPNRKGKIQKTRGMLKRAATFVKFQTYDLDLCERNSIVSSRQSIVSRPIDIEMASNN